MGEEAVRAAIDAEDLKAGILHVLYAVGDSAANKMMESLCMDCKNGELNFTGLDGHMIAWDKTPLEGEFKLLIPKRACQQILNLDPQGKVQITSDGFTARFETEYVTIETRIVSGDFFKTERMFLEMPITAAVNRKKFLDAINRANLLRGEGQAVIISFDTDTMKIKLTNSTADYEEEVELLESINEGIKIGMDPRLLLAALKSFDSENIYINMVDPKSPMKLLSDESDLKAVVLPIAIRTD
ncbi:MAG: hypothetical protein J6M27_05145, partial [Lachnospiraceae bacterium]|nr:hypothetical protein [Lachnospiraceae bacterium]